MDTPNPKYRSNILLDIIAFAYATFFLYTGYFGMFEAPIQRSIHLIFAIVLGFLYYRPTSFGPPKLFLSVDCALAALSVAVFGYFVVNKDLINGWIVFVSEFDNFKFAIALAGLILILEVGRRATGMALPIVGIVMLLYGRFGQMMPGPFYHRGFRWQTMMEVTFFGFDGVFGLPMSVCSTLIIIFIIFGCFFEAAGGGDFLMDLGKYFTGKNRGGPAKISVVTSCLFGAISGSAVANVYATGSFSIPMMKRMGYRPEFAGAVEAVASTGGQLAPPVMGAAAFIMAEFTGISYVKIMVAAIIPTILYYLSIFLQVDFESALSGIKGIPDDEIPDKKAVLGRMYFLIPLILLVTLLLMGKSASFAGAYATLSVVIVNWIFAKGNRMTPKKIFEALASSGKRTVMIATSCAISGIVIGVVAYSGLGMNFVGFITRMGGESLWFCALFVAVASIILGMSVPTTVAYIIVSAVSVPALRSLGFGILPSHMFAFYFALVSMITPPVAPASLAAAEIAGTPFMKTGFTACKLGFITFVIPFMFLFAPELLMIGSAGS
ncbi:MAG: TRAP transporter fused permease subunit, partial [Clostridia bacterium]|nr:TRAP transporter fused permease subunit [Clostridia bacterium]